jgi:excisionase family DNA binding protein
MVQPLALTIAAACKLAGIGRTKIYAMLNSGELPARKCGRKTLILADDLRRCLEKLPEFTPRQES